MWVPTKFRAFFALFRFENSLFVGFSVLLPGLFSGDLKGPQPEYFFGFTVACCLVMGAYAVNDYFDCGIDSINRRYERPLIQSFPFSPSLTSPPLKLERKLKRKTALRVGLFFLLVPAPLTLLLLPWRVFLLILLSIPLFFLYSSSLKKYLLIKNIVAAFGFSAPILFGALLSNPELEPISLYFAGISFILGLGFELMADIPDVAGDRFYGIRTLPSVYSKKFVAKLASFFYALIMLLDPLPFFVNLHPGLYRNTQFLILVLIPVGAYFFVCKALLRNPPEKEVLRLKKRVLVIMQFGALAYLAGVLI